MKPTSLSKGFWSILTSAYLAVLSPLPVLADPVAQPPADAPPGTVLPRVFCFRITDIREDKTDPTHNTFSIEFEILNWTNQSTNGLQIALAAPDSGVRFVTPPPAVDADGRPLEGIDVNGDGTIDSADNEDSNGNGILDPGEDQNGDGRLDDDSIPGNQNPANTGAAFGTDTQIQWDFPGVPPLDLLTAAGSEATAAAATAAANALIPGFPATTSIDAAGAVTPVEHVDDGANVLDGFVIKVTDLAPNTTFQFNWALLNCGEGCFPIALQSGGNAFGSGLVVISRLADGSVVPGLPVFAGNSGVGQNQLTFYDSVFVVPDPARFAAEFGADLTADFVDPADNEFGFEVNAVPAPAGREEKQNALTALEALRASISRPLDRGNLSIAIENVTRSLNDKFYVDADHLDRERGIRVFDFEEEAAEHLDFLARSRALSAALVSQIKENARLLADADRRFAVTLLNESLDAAAPERRLREAKEEIDAGAADAARGRFAKAIEHYERAWRALIRR